MKRWEGQIAKVRTIARIDMVHIGHSCMIGHDTLAGSTDVGNKVILTGQAGVSGYVRIGDGAIAIAQSGIPQDVAPGAMVQRCTCNRSQTMAALPIPGCPS